MREINKLKEMLEKEKIPFSYNETDVSDSLFSLFGGYGIKKQIEYPNTEKRICSVIFGEGTYGYEKGSLEIMGLLKVSERLNDSVVGYLTALEVFERINKHYKESVKIEKESEEEE